MQLQGVRTVFVKFPDFNIKKGISDRKFQGRVIA